jgi:hypothetical protein
VGVLELLVDPPPPPQAINIWVAAAVAKSRSLNDTGIPLELEEGGLIVMGKSISTRGLSKYPTSGYEKVQ